MQRSVGLPRVWRIDNSSSVYDSMLSLTTFKIEQIIALTKVSEQREPRELIPLQKIVNRLVFYQNQNEPGTTKPTLIPKLVSS